MAGIIRTEETKGKKNLEFNIIEECFALPTRENGDVIRLDYASWGNGKPSYELRLWHTKPDGTIVRKGVGLSGNELLAVREFLNEMEEE